MDYPNLSTRMSEELDLTKLPTHIALICDANRRWARSHGLPDLEGHRRGFDTVVKMAKEARKLGIKYFTFWFFSTENWDRTKIEVDYLMNLAIRNIRKVGNDLIKEGVRFRHVGRKDRIPKKLKEEFEALEEKTKHFNDKVITICFDHGGMDELVRGIQKIIDAGVKAKDITKELVGSFLDTHDLPPVDLMIRTGGELRTSGFLTWISPYAELAFPLTYLPDFDIEELKKVLIDFQTRDRRFGKDSKKEDSKFKLVSKV